MILIILIPIIPFVLDAFTQLLNPSFLYQIPGWAIQKLIPRHAICHPFLPGLVKSLAPDTSASSPSELSKLSNDPDKNCNE